MLHTHDDCVSQTVDVAYLKRTGWLALWDVSNPRCSGFEATYRLRIATSADGGAWGRRRLLPAGFEIPALRTTGSDGLQVYRGSRVLVLGARPAPERSPSELNRVLQIARLSRDGLERRRDFDGGRLLYGSDGDYYSALPSDIDDARPVMSLAPDGRGVALWARLVEDNPDDPVGQVYARVREERGRFAEAEALSAPGQPSALAVDVNDRGDAAVAWCQDRVDLLLRTRPADGEWTASERLGACSNANQVDLALGDGGRLAVTWASTGEFAPFERPAPKGVHAAVGDLDGPLSASTLADDGRDAQIMLARETVLVSWSGPFKGAARGVRFARLDRNGAWSNGAISNRRGHELVELASHPSGRGRGLVLWRTPRAFFTRDINRAGRFRPRKRVYATRLPEGRGVLQAANVGVKPASRDAVTVWSHERTTPRSEPHRSTVEAAAR